MVVRLSGLTRSFMRRFILTLTVVGLTLATGVLVIGAAGSGQNAKPSATVASPVVVELFTSEGCSSCPPADALLAKLDALSRVGSAQVVALEEHVDYWDDQGWRDPFSSHDLTTRQFAYAEALGNRNPYTPQMVVDGSVQFSGARADQAFESIAAAGERAKVPVALARAAEDKPGKENLAIEVARLSESPKGGAAEVWLAITETGLQSAVTRGENAGHELRHAAVVRAMRKIGEAKPGREVSFSSRETVSLGKEWNRDHLKAVAFVQEKNSLKILGAAEISLHPGGTGAGAALPISKFPRISPG